MPRHLTTALSLLTTALATAAGTDKRPNILYIMSDDHAYQCISAYGGPYAQVAPTPNIDRLAKEGMRFDRAFVENSISTPSRACLMTGLYSHQNGQRMLGEGIDTTRTFFTELLHEAGYQTALIGKWHMICDPKGFDFYHILNDQGTYYNPVFRSNTNGNKYVREEGYASELITEHAMEWLDGREKDRPFCLMVHHKAPHRAWHPDIKHLGMYDKTTFPLPATWNDDYESRGPAVRSQKMSIGGWMEMANDLKVDIVRPYDPDWSRCFNEYARLDAGQRQAITSYFGARSRYLNETKMNTEELRQWKYQTYLRDYMSVIQSVDESVGELLDYLDKNGLLENTIVVYTSDQGFYMGEHGWFDKRFMYEESFRTPLLVRYPREIKPGSVSRQLVQNIDYAPTFLDYAGVKQPAEMPGRSMKPVLRGEAKSWRKDLYYHYYDYPNWHMVRKHDGVRTDRYKLIHFYGNGGLRAVPENKYQNTPGTVEYRTLMDFVRRDYVSDDPDIAYDELYDLENDPNELHNLADDPAYASIKQQLQKRLDAYRKQLGVDEF